ncbi:hypothetical protein [Labrys monachus]|uniref:Uncharacterized protein n=1 Tax=Labrys monachus TaxID=217067 RepID=A0ABU0FB84_9HYPH|nr:hypothetical protein [Labrys monachus]MDQ0391305.1 hypothetical protein [Labrys monachus]
MLLNTLIREPPRAEFVADAPPEERFDIAVVADTLDDRTTRYVLETRPAFGAVRRAAAQLAGVLVLAAAGGRGADPGHPMLVLAAAGGRGADPGHPMLELAALAVEEASDQVRSCQPPPRARHHHRHLLRAVRQVTQAVAATRDAGRSGREDISLPLALLKDAWQELQWTSATLPGFEIVDFDQACCAVHAPKK